MKYWKNWRSASNNINNYLRLKQSFSWTSKYEQRSILSLKTFVDSHKAIFFNSAKNFTGTLLGMTQLLATESSKNNEICF